MVPRRPERPVALPDALHAYWTMWNEPDVDRVRSHLDRAVTPEVVWADPLHTHVGRDALEANVKALRSSRPEYQFGLASELDVHHERYRYEWDMRRKHRVLLRGLDIVTLAPNGQIERVDGFFGQLSPISETDSGVPEHLRA